MKRTVITPLIVGAGFHSPGHDLMRRLGERDMEIKHYDAKGNVDLLSKVLKDVIADDDNRVIIIEDLDTLFGGSPLKFVVDDPDIAFRMMMRSASFQTPAQRFAQGLPNMDFPRISIPYVDWMIDKPLTLTTNTPKHNREQVNCRGKGNVKPKDNRKTIKQARKNARKSKRK